jgi:hypothetical protein
VTDLVVLGILALAAFVGWRRGTMLMLLTCTGLVAGYLCAWLLYRPVGGAFARLFHVPPLIAMPVAGMLVLTLVSGAVKVLMRSVERRRREERLQGLRPATADLAGGALLGALYAGSFVVVIAWAAQTVNGLLHLGPDLSGSVTGRVAASVMRRATYAIARRATGDPFVASVLSVVASRPTDGVAAVNGLLGDQRVRQLWEDADLRGALTHGDTAALAASPAVQALAADPRLGDAARQLGLVGAEARGPDAFAAALVQQVTPLMQSLEAAKRDPDVQRLLADPRLKDLLERRDFGALAADSGFNALAGQVLQRMRGAPGHF